MLSMPSCASSRLLNQGTEIKISSSRSLRVVRIHGRDYPDPLVSRLLGGSRGGPRKFPGWRHFPLHFFQGCLVKFLFVCAC